MEALYAVVGFLVCLGVISIICVISDDRPGGR